MANHMHFTAGHRGYHRLCMGVTILRRKHRLMKSGDDQIERSQHRSGTVDLAFNIFNIRLNTAQDPHPVYQAGPDAHINEVPVVRGIRHIRAVVGDGEEFDPFTLCFRNIIVQGAVGMGAGDGMHVQVNGIHHILLFCLPQE